MPNDSLNNPVPFRLSSIMENYFCFCEGEDDHAASPHVQEVSPRGPISKKKAPSAISMNTSLSHDTGSRTRLKIDRRVRGLGLPIPRLSLSRTPLVINFPIRATQAAGPPTREPNPQDACLCSETRLRSYRSKTRMTNPTDLQSSCRLSVYNITVDHIFHRTDVRNLPGPVSRKACRCYYPHKANIGFGSFMSLGCVLAVRRGGVPGTILYCRRLSCGLPTCSASADPAG
jgi:hypothetical protein